MMESSGQTEGLDAGLGDIMKDLMTNVPGIDEAMAFAELMKMVLYHLLVAPIILLLLKCGSLRYKR